MDVGEIDLQLLDSERSERADQSFKSDVSKTERKKCRIMRELIRSEDERRDLHYALFDMGILTEQETRKIRMCYERLVNRLRTGILMPQLEAKKESYKTKLSVYCEEFIKLVDERISPHYWVSISVKGNLLRLKADYLRYLFELHPKNGNYQVRAHNAYTETKAYFVTNRLTKSSEWYRMRLNYAALLYLDGFPTAAMFICQQLLKTNKQKLFDAALERRIRKNVNFFKRAILN